MYPYRPIARIERGVRGQIFRSVGLRATRLSRIVERGCAQRHQFSCVQFRPTLRQRMLNGLILTNGPPEDHSFVGVAGRFSEGAPSDSNRFGGNQYPFRIQTIEGIMKPPAFFADPVLHRHRQAINKQVVGIHCRPAHLVNFADLNVTAIQRSVEQRQAIGRFFAFFQRSGARQQHHTISLKGCTGPDFLAIDNIFVAVADRPRLQFCGIQTCIRFGKGKTGNVLAPDQWRQHAGLLFRRAMNHDGMRTKNVHVNRGAGGKSSRRTGYRLHHDGRRRNAQPSAAILFRHRDTQPSAGGNRLAKLVGKSGGAVPLTPPRVIELIADRADRIADIGVFRILGKRGEVGHENGTPD